MPIQAGEPSQRAQPRHEAVFAATHGDKPRQTVKTAADRPLGNGEDAVACVVADEGILLGSVTDEIAVGHPLRLYKLELLPRVRADQREHGAKLGGVILKQAVLQRGTVVRAAVYYVKQKKAYDIVFQGIARIDAANVRAERALQYRHVVRVSEIIVTVWVGAKGGIIVVRRQHQRRAAAPAANHLGGNQLLFLG